MLQYNYYWYHHMMPDKERKAIEKVLNDKDYFGFIELYKKYAIQAIQYGEYYDEFESWCPMTFLPTDIAVWDTELKDFTSWVSILEKENFEKITHHECECG